MARDWRQFVTGIEPRISLFDPATPEEIAEAERAVGAPFPADLKDLLLQTDGVLDAWGYGPISPVGPIAKNTVWIRSIDMDYEDTVFFDSFVVIGTDAGGGMFGFFTNPEEGPGIHFFEHEEGVFEKRSYSLE